MLSELGFAKVAGMEEDLHLVGLQYNVAVAILFVGACSLTDYIVNEAAVTRYRIV